jgi:hypothetical protein
MLADYFTKPLQGAQFKVLRDRIMNVNPSDANTHPDYRSVLKVLDAKRQVTTDGRWCRKI